MSKFWTHMHKLAGAYFPTIGVRSTVNSVKPWMYGALAGKALSMTPIGGLARVLATPAMQFAPTIKPIINKIVDSYDAHKRDMAEPVEKRDWRMETESAVTPPIPMTKSLSDYLITPPGNPRQQSAINAARRLKSSSSK